MDKSKKLYRKDTTHNDLRCDIHEGKEFYYLLSNPDYEYSIKCNNIKNSNSVMDVKLQIDRQRRSWKAKYYC